MQSYRWCTDIVEVGEGYWCRECSHEFYDSESSSIRRLPACPECGWTNEDQNKFQKSVLTNGPVWSLRLKKKFALLESSP